MKTAIIAGSRTAFSRSGTVFADLSVRIAPGEKVALVGESGAGKTSFVKLVQRLYDVDGGAIRIDGADNPVAQPTSNMGYSVGRWEANVLIVETTRIDWPYFDDIGTPQSDSVSVVARFTVHDAEGRLDYHVTVTDPLTFTEPAVIERHWLAIGETVEPYECEVY